jgi:hypothetical protein
VASHGLFVWSQLRLHGWCALMMIDAPEKRYVRGVPWPAASPVLDARFVTF